MSNYGFSVIINMKERVYCCFKILTLKIIKKIVITLSCAFLPITAIAQEYSISGVVEDNNNQPIAYSNIIVSDVKNSNLINGTTSSEMGLFKFEGFRG